MRPAFAMPLAMFLLLRCQQLPVMKGVWLLHHTHKWCELPLAFLLPDIHHFRQPATKIIASVAKIKFRSDVNHVAGTQLRHAAGSAGILDFKKARFAGASGISG